MFSSRPGSPGSTTAGPNHSPTSEFDPGSEGTPAICLTHASRTLFSGSWAEGKEAPVPTCLALLQSYRARYP